MSDNINFEYKKLHPFKWFILENFQFVEDSIDTLTNYQLFSKLGEEINKNIDAINSLGQNQQNLTDGYNSLVDYVDNYFNNLDVDDEINNKLDEMAENGTLYDIINRFLTPTITEQNQKIENYTQAQNIRIDNIQNQVQGVASGSPLVASSVSGMTDHNRIYVNTSDGKWYYWDGDSWEIGGTYQSTLGAVDKTLTQSNVAPDSKIVGDKLIEKNFDLETLTGYKIVQNPNQYVKNTGYAVVSNINVGANSVSFSVDAGQSIKGVSSVELPIKRGHTYTIKFKVTMSVSSVGIKFYYNGGSGTLDKYITGTEEITATWTRAETYQADGALLFFIDTPSDTNVTCTISDLVLFEGEIEDIPTLKEIGETYLQEHESQEMINGVTIETTNSGTYTSNIKVKANKTYKIDVTEITNQTNFFSSTDTSVSVAIARSTGTYYFTPISDGFLTTYAFNVSNFHVKAKISVVENQDVLYVSTTGSDTNSGLAPSVALATIQKAIEKGARNILVKRGKYYHQSVFLSGNGESISIKPYDNNTYTDTVPDRPLVEIINGTELTALATDSTYTSLLSQNFTGNSAWQAVFIDHTLVPSTEGYRGYNNAGLWQISGTEDYSKDLRVTPVLTLTECINGVGTFFWDGTKVYVHPYAEEYETFYAQDVCDYGIRLENLSKVDLQDISVKFSKQSNYYIKNCMDIHLQDCISQYTNVINGFQLNNSNGLLENCQSYNSRDDGFGAQDYGVTTYINCIGNYNSDDGISHHYGERATIIGGEYAHNGKGGVASPTYGAYVNIYNVYVHHNDVGIYATNESQDRDYATRTCFVNNSLITNNRIGIRVGGTTTMIGWNNKVLDNTTNISGENYVNYDL